MNEPQPLPVVVREARRSDAPFVVDSNLAMAIETEGRHLERSTLEAGVDAVFDQPARGAYLVALAGHEPAGCLLVTREWSDWRNADIWWIQSVYVVPAHRGLGVYRALHQAVLERGRQAGAPEVRLYVDRDNTGAQEVYLKMGMERSHYELMEQGL